MTTNIVKISETPKNTDFEVESINEEKTTNYDYDENELRPSNFNNKLISVYRLMDESLFNLICITANAINGDNYAYIPWFNNSHKVEKGNVCFNVNYKGLSTENNYADLGFVTINQEYKFFKAHRVKAINAIPVDGSIATFNEKSINDDTYFVIYSNDEKEKNKVVLITTKAYMKLMELTKNANLKYININNLKYYQRFGITDKQLIYVDDLTKYSYASLLNDDNRYIKNIIENRKKACFETIHIEGFGGFIKRRRTHFGNQYSALNVKTGQIVNFRDAYARDNFFENIGIEYNSALVTSNCINQESILKDLEVEKYKANVYEDSGWVIMKYTPNMTNLINDVKTLLHKLSENSKVWAKRLVELLSIIETEVINSCKEIYRKINKKFEKQLKKVTDYIYLKNMHDTVSLANSNFYYKI